MVGDLWVPRRPYSVGCAILEGGFMGLLLRMLCASAQHRMLSSQRVEPAGGCRPVGSCPASIDAPTGNFMMSWCSLSGLVLPASSVVGLVERKLL